MDDGDRDFTGFVLASRDKLLRTAYLMCGDWAKAEDLTQIALVKLYNAWGRISGSPESYARAIIARSAVDASRRPWRRESVTAAGVLDSTEHVDPDVATRLTLGAAIRRLPARQRQVVVLRHYWGLSIAETAEDLGISAGAVKAHAARAIRRLNELLGEPAEEVQR